MDLSRAYQEVKSLPDEALQKELQSPSGMIPGYLILSEMSDRQAVRGSTGGSLRKRPSMAQEMLQGTQQGFAEGGIISRINPFMAQIESMLDPEKAAALQQEQMTSQNGGRMPLNPLSAPAKLSAATSLADLKPVAPGMPERVTGFSGGGLASLYPRR